MKAGGQRTNKWRVSSSRAAFTWCLDSGGVYQGVKQSHFSDGVTRFFLGGHYPLASKQDLSLLPTQQGSVIVAV